MFKTSTRAFYETGWRSRRGDAEKEGKCGLYVGRGRFAEKGGGQQVGSAFQTSTDNEKIKAIYGNYGFWSWLRYWYLDSVEWLTLAIMDKGYYDYDYQYVEPKDEKKVRLVEDTAKSDEQVQSALARFGWGKSKGAKALQDAVIKDINERKKG